MKAVSGIASPHVDAEGIAGAVDTAFVGVAGYTCGILSNKDSIVVLIASALGFFAALIEQSSPDKSSDGLPVQESVFEQIGVHPAHIPTGRRQDELLLLLLFRSGNANLPLLSIQQASDGLRIGKVIELLDKGDWSAALLCGMVVPVVPADGDAAVTGKPLFTARWQQLLTLPQQELLQVDLAGAAFVK